MIMPVPVPVPAIPVHEMLILNNILQICGGQMATSFYDDCTR